MNGVPESMAVGDEIAFLVRAEPSADDDTMGLFRRADGDSGVALIPVDRLRDNLAKTADTLRKAFAEFRGDLGDLRLNEVQVGLEVSATGGVHLIGTAGVKGAITLVFRVPEGGSG